eukprot:scaffold40533_cov27-Phaeocystis_antarctica.AAC.1
MPRPSLRTARPPLPRCPSLLIRATCACARCTTCPTRAKHRHSRSSSPSPRVRHPTPLQVWPAALQPDRYTCAAALAGRRAYDAYDANFNLGLRFPGRQLASHHPPPDPSGHATPQPSRQKGPISLSAE